MASFDGTLNVAGTSLEFIAVVVGGLAHGPAEPIRRWLRERLSKWVMHNVLWVILSALLLIGAWTMVIPIVAYYFSTPPVEAIVLYWVMLATLIAAVPVAWVSEWLFSASDEALRRVLLTMGTVFGIGVLLQLIAAATPGCHAFHPDPAVPSGRVRPGVVGGGDGAGRGDVEGEFGLRC